MSSSYHLTCIFLYCLSTGRSVTCLKENTAYIEFSSQSVQESKNCILPDSLKLTVNHDDAVYNLTLVVNRNVPHNAPVHEIVLHRDTDYWSSYLPTSHMPNKQVYHDRHLQAAVTVTCDLLPDSPHLHMTGVFVTKDGDHVRLEPDKRHKRSADSRTDVYRMIHEHTWDKVHDRSHDYKIPEKARLRKQEISPVSTHTQRRRRETPDIYIDILAFIDNYLYLTFYNESTEQGDHAKKGDAIENIRQYFANVFNGIALRYKLASPKYNIRLIGYYIETELEGEWLRKVRVNETEDFQKRSLLDVDKLLDSITELKENTSLFVPHDHLMAFTAYDLYYIEGNDTENLLGIAWLDTMCWESNSYSISLIENVDGIMTVISTATHELGHSLALEHDGYDDTCLSEDRYIMCDSDDYPRSDDNLYNDFLFSNCSKKRLSEFINANINEDTRSCFLEPIPRSSSVPSDVTYYGQVTSVDDQCESIKGIGSTLCPDKYVVGNYSMICSWMFCVSNQSTGECDEKGYYAAAGTPCGTSKWCILGRCVNITDNVSTNASSVMPSFMSPGISSPSPAAQSSSSTIYTTSLAASDSATPSVISSSPRQTPSLKIVQTSSVMSSSPRQTPSFTIVQTSSVISSSPRQTPSLTIVQTSSVMSSSPRQTPSLTIGETSRVSSSASYSSTTESPTVSSTPTKDPNGVSAGSFNRFTNGSVIVVFITIISALAIYC